MGWTQVEGQFTRLYSWVDDEANGYDIDSTRMDADTDDIAAGISACLHKGGENTPTANLPMGNNKHTGCDDASELNEYATARQVQNGSFNYPSSIFAGLNTYQLTVSPVPTAYAAGQMFHFKAPSSNSGATQVNVGGLGLKNVFSDGAACVGGEIVVGRMYTIIYDGTQFHLVSGSGGGGATFGGAKICLQTGTSFSSDSWKLLKLNTLIYDTSGYNSSGQLQIPNDGNYRVTCGIIWEAPAGSFGECLVAGRLKVNGVSQDSTRHTVANSSFTGTSNLTLDFTFSYEGKFYEDDTVALEVFHFTNPSYGSSKTVFGTGNEANSTYMAIERIY